MGDRTEAGFLKAKSYRTAAHQKLYTKARAFQRSHKNFFWSIKALSSDRSKAARIHTGTNVKNLKRTAKKLARLLRILLYVGRYCKNRAITLFLRKTTIAENMYVVTLGHVEIFLYNDSRGPKDILKIMQICSDNQRKCDRLISDILDLEKERITVFQERPSFASS